ncbi:lysophospholipid acyltransferase family protein [Microvirga rosea]|uniref:lysophospholipid acyltransferase family protein n=1 Tax=Microvirga rosea TaxID=2715425 RepID=UPI001D0ADCF9|nr:lysophospholipid acyltransferase family protein [Microvirga rosea]MCB8822985.1 lysophospholipid acyltransferase family protein [Microvirga rosea]
MRRYFARHMNSLRLTKWGAPDIPAKGPIIVYSNHSSWWDAVVYIIGSDVLFHKYECYAPIDADMLKQYGIFRRIGAFAVQPGTSRGTSDFLHASRVVLSSPQRALWLTAQGRFADVRERPLDLKAGLTRLIEFAPGCQVLPLAIEYSFWLERGPEAFLAFGPSLRGHDLLQMSRKERLRHLEEHLAATMERLSADVESRDPGRFSSLAGGKAGIGGVYDGWRRVMAALHGRRFDASHEGRST